MRNPYGHVGRRGVAQDWGRKHRKAETNDRGVNHAADRAAIAEGLAEMFEAD